MFSNTTEGFTEHTGTEIVTTDKFAGNNLSDYFSTLKTGHNPDPEKLYIETMNKVSAYFWIVASPILFCAGILGNSLNVAVLRRMRSWHRSTVMLMAVLSFTDMTVICSGLIRYWIKYVFEVDIRLFSNWGCKINLFILYLSMQFSSWTRVSITLERFLMTNFPLKYNFLVTVPRTITLLMSFFVILVCVNGHFFWTNGLINNGTECSSLNAGFLHFDEFIFTYVDLAMLSLLPFIVMLILNIAIVKSLHSAHVRRKQMCSVKLDIAKMRVSGVKLTRTLLFTTTYFLVATVPISINFIVDSYMGHIKKEDAEVEARLDVSWSVSYVFQYTIYTVNFYLYVSLNEQYRKTVSSIFGCKSQSPHHNNRLSSIQSTMSMVKRESSDISGNGYNPPLSNGDLQGDKTN